MLSLASLLYVEYCKYLTYLYEHSAQEEQGSSYH